MNLIKTLTLSILCLSLVVAGEAETKLPVAAEKTIATYNTNATKAFATWKAAVEKERASLAKSLEATIATESKKKGSEAAVAELNKRLDALKKEDWIADQVKESSGRYDDLLCDAMTEKDVLKALVGTWTSKKGEFIFSVDDKGMISYFEKNNFGEIKLKQFSPVEARKRPNGDWLVALAHVTLTYKGIASKTMEEFPVPQGGKFILTKTSDVPMAAPNSDPKK